MKNIIFLTFFINFLLLTSCLTAQQQGIVKAYAYYRHSVAGTIPAEDSGKSINNGIRIQYFIYVETKKEDVPEWDKVTINGNSFTFKVQEVRGNVVKPGRLRNDTQEVTIKKKPGNQLWQLLLTPTKMEYSKNVDSIILSGRWKNKAFTYKIKNVQQLARMNYE
jgi:hypothetical protein